MAETVTFDDRTATDTDSRPAPAPVGLVGAGMLREAVAAALAPQWEVRELDPDGPLVELVAGCAAVIVVSDAWDTRPYPVVRAACAWAGVGWLPVRVELGQVVIGPFSVPGQPGCQDCAEIRRERIRDHAQGYRGLWERHGDRLASTASNWLHAIAADAVATLVADELAETSRRTHHAVLQVRLDTLTLTRRSFLPVPTCPSCGQLPEDSPELATITLRPRPKLAPSRFRTRDLLAMEDQLLATYVDAEYGLVREITPHGAAAFPLASAYLAGPDQPDHAGFGRTRDYRSTRITALAEALERHGATPGGKRTVVRASYQELAGQAVDPRSFGLYPDAWYDQPDFRYQRFSEDLVLDWVWGYSLGRAEPVLVPQDYAYYGHHDPHQPRLAYEISNGCALGGCVEEATAYGLLELVERDAFLMTWYARMPVPQLDLGSATNPAIPLLAEQLEATTGYRLLAFNTTLEQRIPCFWVMAVDTVGGQDRPWAMCGAGSHFDPETGLLNALYELTSMVQSAIAVYPEDQERCARLVADPALVRVMDDHQKVYWHPAASSRLDFLLGSAQRHELAEFAATWQWPVHADLTQDLIEMVSRFTSTGLDVIVVDQTTPEHAAAGFSCVKTIVPGLLPMTFGHAVRRVHGLPRVLEIPHQLGYRDRALTEADLNPDPHPFP